MSDAGVKVSPAHKVMKDNPVNTGRKILLFVLQPPTPFRNFRHSFTYLLLLLQTRRGNFITNAENAYLEVSAAYSFTGREAYSPYCFQLHAK